MQLCYIAAFTGALLIFVVALVLTFAACVLVAIKLTGLLQHKFAP